MCWVGPGCSSRARHNSSLPFSADLETDRPHEVAVLHLESQIVQRRAVDPDAWKLEAVIRIETGGARHSRVSARARGSTAGLEIHSLPVGRRPRHSFACISFPATPCYPRSATSSSSSHLVRYG